MYLEEIDRYTRPCTVVRSGKCEFHITLTQGINRQIRRMCRAAGLHVVSLKRIRIVNLHLGDLPVGKTRPLTDRELAELKRRCGRS